MSNIFDNNIMNDERTTKQALWPVLEYSPNDTHLFSKMSNRLNVSTELSLTINLKPFYSISIRERQTANLEYNVHN